MVTDISKQRLDDYSSNVDAIAESAKNYVASLIYAAITVEGIDASDVAAVRNLTISVLGDTFSIYGDQASAYAAATYDSLMSKYNLVLEGAAISNSYDQKALESSVRYNAKDLVAGNVAGFIKSMQDKALEHVRRTANTTMIDNSDRDFSRGVRYARVPSGRKTCGFCIMLASRGFDYKSRSSAGDMGRGFNRFHDRCDCRVMPGTEDTVIEGYDPDQLYDTYMNARETIYDDADRRWWAKSGSEQAEYGTYNKWIANNIVNEIDTRAPQWAYRGEPGTLSHENGAIPLQKEIDTAHLLNDNGLNVDFRATRSAEPKKTSDIFIESDAWEIKQPTGSEKWNISNQFNEAKGQSDRLILDISKSPFDTDYIYSEVEKQLGFRDDFKEVLIIKDGYLRRIKSETR